MARPKQQPLTIAPTADELLAQQRHTDWEIAHEQGRTRNGRPYLSGPACGAHGARKSKAARSRKACRGKVRDY